MASASYSYKEYDDDEEYKGEYEEKYHGEYEERNYERNVCEHYERGCKLVSPCCNQIFSCRHCHNEAMNDISKKVSERHNLPRHKVSQVVCNYCETKQQAQQFCSNCGQCMGDYFCSLCKFYDNDVSKQQFHCHNCGICRVGGRENFFHCEKCRCCLSLALKDNHTCVEKSMHQNCPVSFEYLFDSIGAITVLPCGHTMHLECCDEMHLEGQSTCPICYKSTRDMSLVWKAIDEEVAGTSTLQIYQNKTVQILCNDCNKASGVIFHNVGLKCPPCGSYNTRIIKCGSN